MEATMPLGYHDRLLLGRTPLASPSATSCVCLRPAGRPQSSPFIAFVSGKGKQQQQQQDMSVDMELTTTEEEEEGVDDDDVYASNSMEGYDERRHHHPSSAVIPYGGPFEEYWGEVIGQDYLNAETLDKRACLSAYLTGGEREQERGRGAAMSHVAARGKPGDDSSSATNLDAEGIAAMAPSLRRRIRNHSIRTRAFSGAHRNGPIRPSSNVRSSRPIKESKRGEMYRIVKSSESLYDTSRNVLNIVPQLCFSVGDAVLQSSSGDDDDKIGNREGPPL